MLSAEYSRKVFPAQESKLHAGSACVLAADGKTGFTIESMDYDRRLLTFKRGKRNEPSPARMSSVADAGWRDRLGVQQTGGRGPL